MSNQPVAREQREMFSATFVFMAALFCVCLIVSNLIASKIFVLGGITLPAAVIVFPISYILNDCLSEVYGYRSASRVIWIGFLLNAFMVGVTQLALLLPGAVFWDNQPAFDVVFGAAPRALMASWLAFLVGSNLNAWVMSRLKVASSGRHFWFRAILSSIVGELSDSLIFIPLMFWSMGLSTVLTMMLCQVSAKVLYEILVLPLTKWVVVRVKQHECIDVYDRNISYNPFTVFRSR